jgi:hypothetical protein
VSYRPPEQELEGPCTKIIEGIGDFIRASSARQGSRDWNEEHLDELAQLSADLIHIELRLQKIKRDTW